MNALKENVKRTSMKAGALDRIAIYTKLSKDQILETWRSKGILGANERLEFYTIFAEKLESKELTVGQTAAAFHDSFAKYAGKSEVPIRLLPILVGELEPAISALAGNAIAKLVKKAWRELNVKDLGMIMELNAALRK